LHGQKVPIVGGLCMDACFIKITDIPNAQVGDVATLMGRDGGQEISPHDIAELTGTVSYDVLAGFGKRLPRLYVRGNNYLRM
jgi:alanine racemase